MVRTSKTTVIVVIILLLLALGLRLALPGLARFYNERGFQEQTADRFSDARESYQRALRLRPSFAQAHYNLATIYEDLEPEEAIREYLLAIRSDSGMYSAYNNLARLYIMRGKDKDYDAALQNLSKAVEVQRTSRVLSSPPARVQYSLYKNLGWVNYLLKHYDQAEMYLVHAISFQEQGNAAAAHCLLAYVLKEQNKPGATDECEDCVRFAPGEADVEAKWVSDARECLMKGGIK